MTQSSYFLTNGSSLEDCHTNFFALADLTGIKWRQYSSDKHFNDLNEDPILNSFAKCINANLLCVWRRIRNNNNTQDTNPTRDLLLNYSKELWIFWYEDEPDLKELLSNNLIGYSRIGNWFIQTKKRDLSENYDHGTQITFRFNFFLHGDSNVCANVDVRQHPSLRPITKEDLLLSHQFSDGMQVILAPYGLQASVKGLIYKDNDPNVQKFLSDWNKIYPIASIKSSKEKSFISAFSENLASNTPANHSHNNDNFANKVIEVVVGNNRMKYPISYVFICESDLQNLKTKQLINPTNINQIIKSSGYSTNPRISTSSENIITANHQNNSINQTSITTSNRNHSLSNDVYNLKNKFYQVKNNCDQNYLAKSSEKCNDLAKDLLLRKNCSCNKCQNPNFRRHLKLGSSMSMKNKIDKEKSKFLKSPGLFHSRNCTNVVHDLNSLFGTTTIGNGGLPNLDNSPLSASILASSNSNNHSAITPLINPYKSPVSTSTSSILNTPGIESSPMSNFNVEAQEHISPMPSTKDEILSISTPNTVNNQNVASPKDNLKIFDSIMNQINSVDSQIFRDQNTLSEKVTPTISNDNLVFNVENVHIDNEMNLNKKQTRSYRYKSIYDDESTYKLRNGLLYDFRSENICWEDNPVPKNRRTRTVQIFNENLQSEEFGEFEDLEYLGSNFLEYNINECDYLSNIKELPKIPNRSSEIEQNCSISSKPKESEIPESPNVDELNEYTKQISSETETLVSAPTNINNNSNILGPAELLRMFPTPPSLEAMVSSPCSTYVSTEAKIEPKIEPIAHNNNIMDHENIESIIIMTTNNVNIKTESESKDDAVVYKPPIQSIFITSNKYAPLENIDCFKALPQNFHYKHNHSRSQHRQNNSKNICMHSSNTIQNSNQTTSNSLILNNNLKNKSHFSSSMQSNKSSFFSNSIIRMPRSGCQNIVPPQIHPRMRNQMNNIQQSFTSSPVVDGFNTSPLSSLENRRSPFLFSQQSINSPSNSNLSIANSNGPSSKNLSLIGSGLYSMNTNIDSKLIQPISNDCNSLILNLLLSDSMFNLFKDHNFDSCSICVCNMNIKGTDVGVYLPDTQQNLLTNNDYYTTCTCGFSALTNRHLSNRSGLFYEDEVEITGIFYDPIKLKRLSLNNESLIVQYLDKDFRKSVSDLDENYLNVIIDQTSTMFASISTLSSIMYYDSNNDACLSTQSNDCNQNLMNLIYEDFVSVISISIQMARGESDHKMLMNNFSHQSLSSRTSKILHEWQFNQSNLATNNHDVMFTLKSLQPLIQESIQRKGSSNEVTYNTVKGPLTWRQFHSLAGRGTEYQCEPQPIPPLLVGYDKECVALSPLGLKFWEKFSLEPYAITRDIYYVVIVPNDDLIIPEIRNFFKELSTVYEILRLGRHSPLTKTSSDGIYLIDNYNNNKYDMPLDDWFTHLGESFLANKIRSYAQILYELIPSFTSVLDRKSNNQSNYSTTFNCPTSNAINQMNGNISTYIQTSNNSSMFTSSYPKSMNSGNNNNNLNNTNANNVNANERMMIDPYDSNQNHNQSLHNSSTSSTTFQPFNEEEDQHKYPSIMIYVLESFSSINIEIAKFGSMGLLKVFSLLEKYFPDQLKYNIHFQILSTNSIISNDKDFRDYSRFSQLKELSFAIYSQCKQQLIMRSNIKSLTGLGPAASFERFLRSKDQTLNRIELHTTPYILAPLKDKQTELGEMFGDRREKSQILFCSYCLTDDKKWLVASCTNDKGDILQTKVININIPNRTRRRKASIRRFGLDKLMRFVQSVMSESVQPWRLIIGRLGRIGHGELKDWTFLLSKKSLMKYSRQLKEMCDQCGYVAPNEQPAIYSACLISLEADTVLRVFPNYYTPDERFSSSCNTCSLSTPEDASCTHILVFPTSATTQASHANFNLNEEFFSSLDESDIPVEDEFFDTLWDDGLLSPRRDGPQADSPGNRQVFGNSSSLKNSSLLEVDQDEPAQLLQQPLALAFYVSTAKTGPLPKWFWTHCPQLENICPVFLKSALLIHTPFVQQNSDDLLQSTNRDCHSLDSNLTTDVLRCCLEGYNALSWLVLDPVTNDRLSCLPIHIQALMQLYHTVQALVISD
ncbi:Citron Rho-interacting kinase [Sarcoptes scabiei]|nr:Citron Rho-interacting kinase [Sarcoptes scabiei]